MSQSLCRIFCTVWTTWCYSAVVVALSHHFGSPVVEVNQRLLLLQIFVLSTPLSAFGQLPLCCWQDKIRGCRVYHRSEPTSGASSYGISLPPTHKHNAEQRGTTVTVCTFLYIDKIQKIMYIILQTLIGLKLPSFFIIHMVRVTETQKNIQALQELKDAVSWYLHVLGKVCVFFPLFDHCKDKKVSVLALYLVTRWHQYQIKPKGCPPLNMSNF